jgi:ribose transport system permease protein
VSESNVATTSVPATETRVRAAGDMLARFLTEMNGLIVLVLVGLVVLFTVLSDDQAFLSSTNVTSMSISASEILILAVGATFVLISGELDLSIGSVLILAGVVATDVMNRIGEVGLAIAAGVAAGLAVGVGAGALNGLLTTRLRVPSFIVTLGMLGMAMGAAQLVTTGSLSQQVPQEFSDAIGSSDVLGIPTLVVIAAAIAVAGWLTLSHTRFGLACAAVGSNRDAARRAGVRVDRLRISVFILMGGLAAIVGLLDAARFSSVSVASHQQDNLAAIAAVIIGGTSLFGGRGSIGGTVIGTLIPVVLLSGLIIQGVEPFWQNIAIGAILIAAVAVDQFNRERLARGELSAGARRRLQRERDRATGRPPPA